MILNLCWSCYKKILAGSGERVAGELVMEQGKCDKCGEVCGVILTEISSGGNHF